MGTLKYACTCRHHLHVHVHVALKGYSIVYYLHLIHVYLYVNDFTSLKDLLHLRTLNVAHCQSTSVAMATLEVAPVCTLSA